MAAGATISACPRSSACRYWGRGPGNCSSNGFARGRPPGVLAHDHETCVGWLQVGPRRDIPEWNNPRRASTPLPDAPADDERVWAASCFFVRKAWRGRGVTAALLDGGIIFARENGARLLEAAPMDHEFKRSSEGLYVGPERVFLRAGFVEVARQKEGRPLMRLAL